MQLHKIGLGAQQLLSPLHHNVPPTTAATPGAVAGVAIGQASIYSMSDGVSDAATELRPLFGGSLPWNETGKVTWVSVDDRVRGGSSTSSLMPRTADDGSSQDAVFSGCLDTSTLGGAGFASVSSIFEDPKASWDLSGYDGILLDVSFADDKKYTFNLKDTVPPRRPDGRMESGVSYEFDFDRQAALRAPRDGESARFTVPWSQFMATYRGRPVEAQPVRTERLMRLGIMVRSFFDKQSGPFNLTLHAIAAYKLHSGADS